MTKLETTLMNVTVYLDRARVTRQGQIALEPGMHLVEIPDLSIYLNPDSARATARGTARARLMGLQVQRVVYTETPAEQVRELESQLEAAQDQMQGLDTKAELVKQSRAKLDALAGHTQVYATALAAGETSVEAQLALFDGLCVRAAQLDTELQEIVVQKRTLDRRVQQLKRQLEMLRSSRPRERYAATLEVEALSAGDLTVELTYVVANAGWKPLYDMRLIEEGDKGSLEVSYLAQVTQQSGEDWKDVSLTLSTARPALAATLPELDVWYIQPRPTLPPAPMRTMAAQVSLKAKGAPAPMAMDNAVGAAEMAEVEAAPVMASVDSTGAAVTYHAPATATIPADGAPHKVNVARYLLSPKLDYVTAPKLAEAAYRRAKVVNDSPYTLLPGAANLFAGDEFIGATQMELVAPQGEIELYLGADDRLKVERELKRRDMDKTLIGGKRRIRFGYEIRLENLLPLKAVITVHDQIPVSRHEDLKVKLESAEPKPTQQSELNLLDWEFTLDAKEKRTIRFDFVVEYPPTMQVMGV